VSVIFDIFLSICQTEVDGVMPSEKTMFKNFFEQVQLADALNFKTAWVAETHLSCQVQKKNPWAVIPHFEGEIGLNTDLMQIAHLVFSRTKKINIGSAIRNIICNGGPIAHAEAVKTFLSLHSQFHPPSRKLELGFAAGRFPFSNIPYGMSPRNAVEKAAWPALRGKLFLQATEIFLRLLKEKELSSDKLRPITLTSKDFRTPEDWKKVQEAESTQSGGGPKDVVTIPAFWPFAPIGVIPFDAPLEYLNLTIGAHWAAAQDFANEFMPVGVFNLSITPPEVIEATHQRMASSYHKDGGAWNRSKMPRTVLVFISDEAGLSLKQNRERAHAKAVKANETYWKALEGTLDPMKVANAVDNALVGAPEDIVEQVRERFHPEDRLMLWFDLNNHDSVDVQKDMRTFMVKVAPKFA